MYYVVRAPIGHETVDIRSVFVEGLVELYALRCPFTSAYLCSQHSLPNATHYSQTTANTGRTSVSLQRHDEVDGTLYLVGVNSLSMYAAYQLSASFESSVLRLQEGVAVMDHARIGEVDYYSFYFNQPFVSLKFSLTTMSGDPDMYISTTFDRPSPTNSTWQATFFGSDTLVIDPRVDTRACVGCMYYIAGKVIAVDSCF
jgi:hypothetical protein